VREREGEGLWCQLHFSHTENEPKLVAFNKKMANTHLPLIFFVILM
jgi:hypothetical protein